MRSYHTRSCTAYKLWYAVYGGRCTVRRTDDVIKRAGFADGRRAARAGSAVQSLHLTLWVKVVNIFLACPAAE
jgi:hypothetical protein